MSVSLDIRYSMHAGREIGGKLIRRQTYVLVILPAKHYVMEKRCSGKNPCFVALQNHDLCKGH
jgi:hypothetical protein